MDISKVWETLVRPEGDVAARVNFVTIDTQSRITDRAISYRQQHGFDHLQVALSIGVQKMMRSDTAGAGVMFSIDTDTGFPPVVLINAAWGHGENVVRGTVNPDQYTVLKSLRTV
jgi:pyruvate,water dikinase